MQSNSLKTLAVFSTISLLLAVGIINFLDGFNQRIEEEPSRTLNPSREEREILEKAPTSEDPFQTPPTLGANERASEGLLSIPTFQSQLDESYSYNQRMQKRETSIKEKSQAISFQACQIYWVAAGKKGDGTSESNPAGNITYVLHSYNLTDDIVKVKPGRYNDAIEKFPLNVTDYNSITLESTDGSSKTTIRGKGDTHGFVVRADGITIKGFTIKQCGGENDGRGNEERTQVDDSNNNRITDNTIINNYGEGITLDASNNNRIINNTITNYDNGIRLDDASNNTITSNTITNNSWAGISLWSSSNTSIQRNIISNNHNGIWVGYSSNNTIANNTIIDNLEGGIPLDSSSNTEIMGNLITTNGDGITLNPSSNTNTITNNTITNNEDDGIYLWTSNNTRITDNTITNNTWGVYVYFSGNSTVRANTIMNNHWDGIALDSSDNNIIISNTITDNYWDGIHLADSSGNKIVENIITNNDDDGIDIDEHSKENEIGGNTIKNNEDKNIERGEPPSQGIPMGFVIAGIGIAVVIAVGAAVFVMKKSKRFKRIFAHGEKNLRTPLDSYFLSHGICTFYSSPIRGEVVEESRGDFLSSRMPSSRGSFLWTDPFFNNCRSSRNTWASIR